MYIYGTALIAGCYFMGNFLGEILGTILGISANVGGVGFAMIFLILISDFLRQRKLFYGDTEKGIEFWKNMYIPISVAMAACQNTFTALNGGFIAILAGALAVLGGFALLPVLNHKKTTTPGRNN